MKDLFEDYFSLPYEVRLYVDVFNHQLENLTDVNSYDLCKELIKNLEECGYTCECDLDGMPYGLRKI